jgi:hypothetical protein
MRPFERIDNFLNKVDWRDLLFRRWQIPYEDNELLEKCIAYFDSPPVPDYWKENPDQRIGQVLINLGLIPDNLKIWMDEESNILIDQGIAPEECLYWTSLYDKDNNLLEEPITRLVADLEPGHIKSILKMCYKNLSEEYKKAFDNILQKYCPGITYEIE